MIALTLTPSIIYFLGVFWFRIQYYIFCSDSNGEFGIDSVLPKIFSL